MRKQISLLILMVVFASGFNYGQGLQKVPYKKYIEYSKKAVDHFMENRDASISRWKENIDPESIFGYRPPGGFLEVASILTRFYELEGKKKYARQAKDIILNYGDFRKEFPEWAVKKRPDYSEGVPVLPDFFTVTRFLRPYEYLCSKGWFSAEEQAEIAGQVANSIKYLLITQEWGPMNRGALRAETLAWAIRVFPDHPDADTWRMYEKALGFDNWGNWEIEDATHYHAIWLYALLGYADARKEMKELFQTPEMYYYAKYFLNLMCPGNMVPDFGDAYWQSNWNRFLVFFEAAAAVYQDEELKWAANTIANTFINFEKPKSLGLAYLLMDCAEFGDENLDAKVPDRKSMEVMEDIVGKKIVFRDGWDAKSSYMLLNYRDEGDGGKIFRDYLRDAICVEEEKLTHGHSDENSISLLMHNGSILLSDAGYREYLPSGKYGAYRSDYFHNRLCVRQEKIFMGQEEGEYRYNVKDRAAVEGQGVLEFMRNAGSYRQVKTQKIDFLTFDDFDYSRTRLIDDNYNYEWDRVISYLKEPQIYVVFDILKSRTEAFFTASTLWYTQEIMQQGDHWYDTRYKTNRSYQNDTTNHLLMYFPKNHYRLESVEAEDRNYQDEFAICQYSGQFFELGQHIGFITVLVPHEMDENPQEIVKRIKAVDSEYGSEGLSVLIDYNGKKYQVGAKADLRKDMVIDYARPKYTWEAGKVTYGDVTTNADFFYLKDDLKAVNYTVVNYTRALYRGEVLVEQPSTYFGLPFDGSEKNSGYGKARYWKSEKKYK